MHKTSENRDRSWRKGTYCTSEFDPDIIERLKLKDWRYNRVQCKNCIYSSEIPNKTWINCNIGEGEQFGDVYIVCEQYTPKPGVKKGDFMPYIKEIFIFDNKLIKQFPIFPISYFPKTDKEKIYCKDCRYHRIAGKHSKSVDKQILVCSYSGCEQSPDIPHTCKRFETRNNNPWHGKKPNITNRRQEEKQPVLTQLLLPLASE